jgi:hypothetical protein
MNVIKSEFFEGAPKYHIYKFINYLKSDAIFPIMPSIRKPIITDEKIMAI